MTPRRDPELRFWEKVDKNGPIHPTLTTPCWIWTAFCNADGYGVFGTGAKTLISPHRFSWELHFGPIPDGLWVLHKCDNPPCVNPSHLFLGTQLDNIQDMLSKGRASHYQRNKTHCKHGHPFSKENTYVYLGKQRMCRTCHRDRERDRARERRASL